MFQSLCIMDTVLKLPLTIAPVISDIFFVHWIGTFIMCFMPLQGGQLKVS